MTARGHASSFARSNLGDKQIVERATVMEWVEAFGSTESLQVVSVASGSPNSFPDFTAHVDGAHISIELTELLHSKNTLKLASKRRLNFEEIQWTESYFRDRIQERLDAKCATLAHSGHQCDILIIHSDEPWLTPQKISEWLANGAFDRRKEIVEAYLLITYVPGWTEHWPVFRIYSALG